MAEEKESAEADSPEDEEVVMSEREIDQNLIDTFPASDPPSWTLGTDHRDQFHGNESGEENDSEN